MVEALIQIQSMLNTIYTEVLAQAAGACVQHNCENQFREQPRYRYKLL